MIWGIGQIALEEKGHWVSCIESARVFGRLHWTRRGNSHLELEEEHQASCIARGEAVSRLHWKRRGNG